MSVLLVSQNGYFLGSLKSIFHGLGEQSVLEAGNLQEFEYFLDNVRGRISLVVVDGDINEDSSLFVELLKGRANCCNTVKGWIRPSYTAGRNGKMLHPGYGFALSRPFGERQIVSALFVASKFNMQMRSKLVYYHSGDACPAGFPQARPGALLPGMHWSETRFATSPVELDSAVAAFGPLLGAVLIDPRGGSGTAREVIDWFKHFKKTPAGQQTPLVCVTGDPEAIKPFRQLCVMFCDCDGSRNGWLSFLGALEKRIGVALANEFLFTAAKSALKTGNSSRMACIAGTLVSKCPGCFETHMLAGEYYSRARKFSRAAMHFKRAINLNPCWPGAYIQLFSLPAARVGRIKRYAEMALKYCPGIPEIHERIKSLAPAREKFMTPEGVPVPEAGSGGGA